MNLQLKNSIIILYCYSLLLLQIDLLPFHSHFLPVDNVIAQSRSSAAAAADKIQLPRADKMVFIIILFTNFWTTIWKYATNNFTRFIYHLIIIFEFTNKFHQIYDNAWRKAEAATTILWFGLYVLLFFVHSAASYINFTTNSIYYELFCCCHHRTKTVYNLHGVWTIWL